jgi:hypothetical protein
MLQPEVGRIYWVFVACAVAGMATLSCSSPAVVAGGPADPTYTSYVGDAAVTGVKVGAVTEGGKLAIFFCGDAVHASSHTRWFKLDLATDSSFTASEDGWKVQGTRSANAVSGTLTVEGGETTTWTATSTSATTAEGLYEARDSSGRAGVIVDKGDVSQGVFIRGAREAFMQITPVAPLAGVAQDIHVRFIESGVLRTLLVRRARP